MNKYEFSIIASGLDPHAADFEARFYDKGCDDATVSFQKGHIILDFAREAADLDAAVQSAISDVIEAGATADRIEPDPLVSLADIARRSGLTRAAVSLYALGQRGSGFPSPVSRITTDTPLWDWANVAEWLFKRGTISSEALEAAKTIKRKNAEIADQKRAAQSQMV